MAPSKEDLERYERAKGNSSAKGWNGKRKRHYTGKYRKRRKARTLQLVQGDVVVYKSGAKVFRGIVHEKCQDDSYVVKPGLEDGLRNDVIDHSSCPKMFADLQIKADEYTIGMTVLVTWQQMEDGFVELVPAQLMEVHDDYCWVITGQQHESSGGFIKVGKDEMCHILDESQELSRDASSTVSVNRQNVNVIRLVLHATQAQLNQMTVTYNSTKAQLQSSLEDSHHLQTKNEELEKLMKQSMEQVIELEQQLESAVRKTQADKTLYDLISQQKDMLDDRAKQIIAFERDILQLRQEYQHQQQTFADNIGDLQQQITQLESNNKELHKDNIILNRQLHQLEEEREEYLYLKNKEPSKPGLMSAKGFSQRKSESFIKIDVPSKASGVVTKKTLKRRADKLNQVLEMISSPNPQPDTIDVVTTLAAYMKQHPDIALSACQAANLTFKKELTAQNVVDLKVLLKLPMSKLQDLRRFLANHGIKFMPSDHHLYRNMRGRESLSPDIVEIGVMSLQKSAGAEGSSVAFARVKNLEEYITRHVNLQFSLGKTWQLHEKFQNEIWIKVGGDKGGSSTKLAMQLVNQVNSNSRDGTNILAMFDAPDTQGNLRKVYDIYHEQLEDLQKKKEILVNGTVMHLRTLFYGDYEAICKSLGHMGPSSSYPCVWCNITLGELRKTNGVAHCPKTKKDGEWVDNTNWPPKRTVEQYAQDLADLEKHTSEGTRKVAGAFHSISGKPILPLVTDLDHVIPPSLHILLGLVVRYFKLLELECRRLDHGELKEGDGKQFDQWQEASEKAKVAEIEKVEAELSLKQEQELLQGMTKAKRGKSKGMCNEACHMPLCALTAIKPDSIDSNRVQWIQCTKCGINDESGWFHAYCVGVTEEQAESPEMDNFVCPVCKGEVSCTADVLKLQEERVSASKALLNDRLEAWNNAKKNLDVIYKEVCALRGSIEKELNTVLETKLHVKRQAYHSQCFVGNHCKEILDKKDILLSVVPDGDVRNRFKGLFGRLRGVVDLFEARFLSDQEVTELKVRCWDLGHWFPKNFPQESIPPKLHFLICHIPECAERWRTIGLLSEHGLESVHADINAIERVYCTVRDAPQRMKLVLGNHQQRATANRSALKPSNKNIRRCQNVDSKKQQCKGRYKKANAENERKCGLCNHTISF